MKIELVTPALPSARNGNSVTALRWARFLKRMGHRVRVSQFYTSRPCDLLIALHARRSFESIRRFQEQHPDLPLIVALTGTDLYRDIKTNRKAQKSLEIATRLVVLQSMALEELPRRLQSKTRVIYQSADRVNGHASEKNGFRVCVVGHLRPEKDPLRTALAVRQLPESSRISVVHVGGALTDSLKKRAARESKTNPRYHWMGEMPYGKTRRILAESHLLSLTSVMEGSSNALSEALASSVPVIASKIPGLIGTLGKDYPGYFQTGDTRNLGHLLYRVETDSDFYQSLSKHCARLAPLIDPAREQASWKELLREFS
ncbi:MAG: selenoneine biosynthesis selenosugar synthase SenB [Candidatus Binatia bacterium]